MPFSKLCKLTAVLSLILLLMACSPSEKELFDKANTGDCTKKTDELSKLAPKLQNQMLRAKAKEIMTDCRIVFQRDEIAGLMNKPFKNIDEIKRQSIEEEGAAQMIESAFAQAVKDMVLDYKFDQARRLQKEFTEAGLIKRENISLFKALAKCIGEKCIKPVEEIFTVAIPTTKDGFSKSKIYEQYLEFLFVNEFYDKMGVVIDGMPCLFSPMKPNLVKISIGNQLRLNGKLREQGRGDRQPNKVDCKTFFKPVVENPDKSIVKETGKKK